MAPQPGVLEWLLEGDPSIAYQTARDLFGEDRPDLRARIATEGWGAALLAARRSDGHWGRGFYVPKWTSTHYTLLDLRNLAAPATGEIRASLAIVLEGFATNRGGNIAYNDLCVKGMALHYAAWFDADQGDLSPVVDVLLDNQMGDGGWNCLSTRSGARHSSLHTTISVLEGIESYRRAGHDHRLDEAQEMASQAREFILRHRFYRSERTGEVIRKDFLRTPTHPRWYFTTLRALDHFATAGAGRDPRMDDALAELARRRRPDGRWVANASPSGDVHLQMEPTRRPSRIVTLAALRVLAAYG